MVAKSNSILAIISADSATSLSRFTSFLYIALSTYSSEESLSIRLMITFLMSLIFFYCSVHDARNYFIYFQLCSLYFCVSSNLLHSNCIFIFSMLSLLSASFAEEHKPLACKLSSLMVESVTSCSSAGEKSSQLISLKVSAFYAEGTSSLRLSSNMVAILS